MGDGEHLRAEVDAGQRDALRIEAQVESGPDRHLENLAGGLRTGPRA